MTKAFEFADFVQEFWVDLKVYEKQPGYYANNGKWIEGKGEKDEPKETGGIILPLNNDELRYEANGVYTSKDRKIYSLEPFKKGDRVEYNGQSYTIDSSKDYEAYADVYIYFAKGVGKQ